MKTKVDKSFGASQIVKNYAKELRRNQTPAEALLWEMLRGRNLNGLKFRRQHPLKNYIADFYCHELRLVIELDGKIHELQHIREKDLKREEAMKALGVSVIRFNNDVVFSNPDKIAKKVMEFKLRSSSPK